MNQPKLYTINQIKESENIYIKKNSLNKLFDNATTKIITFIKKNYKKKKILFVCGPGNNGMDGKLTYNKISDKYDVSIFTFDSNNKINLNKFKNLINNTEIIFDCIFGIGLNKKISGNNKKIIELINKSNKKIVAVDIPSGLHGDSGERMNTCIVADITLAMGFLKPGYFLHPAKEFIGKLELLDLGLPVPNFKPNIKLINKKNIKNIPSHHSNINKYDKGHVLVIGGEMAGASRLVAYSSRKTGCGLSTISVEEKNLKFYSQTEPGTIIKIFNNSDLINKDVLVIGPGLGKSFKTKKLLEIIDSFHGPKILDADAISIFENKKKQFSKFLMKQKNFILTPHTGEFKRVFNYSKKLSKLNNCLEASKLIGNCVLLKGNDSVIAFPDENIWINNLANQNLATAGSGDVLCGIIAGLLAQKMTIEDAVPASLYIQSKISKSKKNVVVEDFIGEIPIAINSLKK